MKREHLRKKVDVTVDSKNNFTIFCREKLSDEEKKEVIIKSEKMFRALARLDEDKSPEALNRLAENEFDSNSGGGFFGFREPKIKFEGKRLTKEEFKNE